MALWRLVLGSFCDTLRASTQLGVQIAGGFNMIPAQDPKQPLAQHGEIGGIGGKNRFGSKNDEKIKVLRMGLPIVEKLSGLQESLFNLFRSPQLNSRQASDNCSDYVKFFPFPLFPHVGPMVVWGLGLGSY